MRSRERVALAELEQPAHLREALGPVPESVRGRRAWRQTARVVEDYRQRFQVTDADRPLGVEPARDADPERHTAGREASGAVERMQARQRQRDREQQRSQAPRPDRSTPFASHPGDQPTRRPAPAREPDPVQGAERAAG